MFYNIRVLAFCWCVFLGKRVKIQMQTVEYNLSELRKEIEPYTPIIVAVTKYFDETKLVEAYEDGLRDFGENRVQDALTKFAKLPQDVRDNSRFHLIGHLQSNKVKKAVGNFYLIQSVDSLKLAKAISDEAQRKNLVQKVLLQVNNAREEAKTGFLVEDLLDSFEEILSLKGISVEGLMNIAPIASEERLSELFCDMRNLKEKLEKEFSCKLSILSMGMSGDYKIALQQGSNMIRIGRKLFK